MYIFVALRSSPSSVPSTSFMTQLTYSLRIIKITSVRYVTSHFCWHRACTPVQKKRHLHQEIRSGDFSRGRIGQLVENVRGSSGGLTRRLMAVVVGETRFSGTSTLGTVNVRNNAKCRNAPYYIFGVPSGSNCARKDNGTPGLLKKFQ